MKMLKCKKCERYTLNDSCPICGGASINPEPARYSPQDKWGKYRRMLKKQIEDG